MTLDATPVESEQTIISEQSIEPEQAIAFEKQRLRKHILAKRKTITAQQLEEAGLSVIPYAQSWYALRYASCVALYIAMGHEVPTLPLIHHILRQSKRVIVPRLGTGMEIGWSEVHADTQLQSAGAAWRPLEPNTEVLPKEALVEADCIITAGLAVDTSGTRLGRGGGWYDRALQYRRAQAPIMTLLWPWEVMDTPLPVEAHDIQVQGALTPESILLW